MTINQARAGRPDQRVADQLHRGVQRVGDGLATGDVTLAGTAGGTTAVVTGGATTTRRGHRDDGRGTVVANIAAGAAQTRRGTRTTASTSTDNTVTFDDRADGDDQPGRGQADPTSASPIDSRWSSGSR